MPRALQHEYPHWKSGEGAEDCGSDDGRYVWPGLIRFVSKQRARKLRKRGVPLLPMHRVLDRSGGEHRRGQFEPTHGDRARYAWFVDSDTAQGRALAIRREARNARREYIRTFGHEPAGRVTRIHDEFVVGVPALGDRMLGVTGPLSPAQEDDLRAYVAYVESTLGPLPQLLQREDETDREFVARHLAAGNVPEPPRE